ncbi:hypothetical protein DEO72_LG11g2548 [Vigna unguiculata]|uniref:F-box domain-containing protein n=1 Tax=Vigna unguiculata TaxID=3917 RepID=A0A4D6NUS0_VIGUN|nr:hypothetical protein DEO72_LG11g2548 [Vigna unguiculata]
MERLPVEICMKIFGLLDYCHLAVAQQEKAVTTILFTKERYSDIWVQEKIKKKKVLTASIQKLTSMEKAL